MVASSLLTSFQPVSYFVGLASAFAVRRSTRALPPGTEPLAEAVGRNTVNRRQRTSPERDRWRPSPAKRRKINGEAGYWATQKAASNSVTAKVLPPLARPNVAETYLDSESDEFDSGEETESYQSLLVLSHCAQYLTLNTFCSHGANKPLLPNGTLMKQLSTFVPNDQNVVGELAGNWTIRLDFKDVCTWRLSSTLMGT